MKNNDIGTAQEQRTWTYDAINCYKRGCSCEGCFYKNFFTDDKCQMKTAVLELVKIFGVPEYKEIEKESGEIIYIIKHKPRKNQVRKPYPKRSFEYHELISKKVQRFINTRMYSLYPKAKNIAGLLIEGYSRQDVCKLIKLPTLQQHLGDIHKLSGIEFKRRKGRMEQFVKWGREQVFND